MRSVQEAKGNVRRTKAERSALSDKRMFDAAIQLINEHGTQKATLKDIGEVAGYSRSLASHRFGSKEGLLLRLFEDFDWRWKDHLNNHVGDTTGVEAIKAAANALREFLKRESSYMRAMYILWYESLGQASEIRSRLAHHHQIYRDDATNWVRQGIQSGQIDKSIDAEQFAAQFCAFMFGTVYQWLVNSEALDLDALFKEHGRYVEKLLTE